MDGTQIEANANKYTFVWNKSVDNYDRKLDEKIKNHLREIDRIVAEENEIYLDDDLGETEKHLPYLKDVTVIPKQIVMPPLCA